VVEHHHPVGHPQRVVVGDRRHPRAELDVLRALGRGGDEDLRRRDDLAAGGVVLTDPRLVVTELVQVLDDREIPLDRQRRVLAGRVERGEERAEAESRHVSMMTRITALRLVSTTAHRPIG
jgi:hypothetical protein